MPIVQEGCVIPVREGLQLQYIQYTGSFKTFSKLLPLYSVSLKTSAYQFLLRSRYQCFFNFFFYFEVTAAILLPLQIYNHDIWCPRKSLYTNFEIGPILKYLPATPLMTKEGHWLLRKLAETNFGQTDRHRDYQRALITMFFKTIISWVLRVLSINVKCFTYFKCI